MTDEKLSGLNLEVLRQRLRKTPGVTVEERKEGERRAVRTTDARRLRVGVRTVQMNLRVTPVFKEQLYELARNRDLTMTELIERGVAALVREEKRKGK